MNRILDEVREGGRGYWSQWYTPSRHIRRISPVLELQTGRRYIAIHTRTGRLMDVRHCVHCGGRFLSSRWDAQFCSDRCRKANARV